MTWCSTSARSSAAAAVAGAGAGLAVVAVVASAYWLGQETSGTGERASSAAPASGQPVLEPPAPVPGAAAGGQAPSARAEVDSSTGTAAPPASTPPIAVAEQWLRVYREVRWDDPTPTSWIDRALPLVGPDLAAEYQAARGGSPGAEWPGFVSGQCVTIARDVIGTVPVAYPASATSTYVDVVGTIATECAVGAPVAEPEPFTATVELEMGVDGQWRVTERIY